ncbi:MAG: hypothetical protein QOE80_1093 [Actinomycetota bacterium]|jgi:hypothetical protein|nr:hypothetical protein [Actinomycetota bacterium]
MICPVVERPSADREVPGGSCAEGQLIGMTEWALPQPELEADGEVPCPRP